MILLALSGAAAAAALWAIRGPLNLAQSGPKAHFRLHAVDRGGLTRSVASGGVLNAVVTVQVGSQISGRIQELLADFNTEVRKDQIIARIDSQNFEARVRQAEAELAVAKANVAIQRAAVERDEAELQKVRSAKRGAEAQSEKARVGVADALRDLQRKEELYRRKVVSRSQVDDARTLHEQALAQHHAALAQQQAEASLILSREAALRMAAAEVDFALAQVKFKETVLQAHRVDLAHTIIRSPEDGVVIERAVDIGQIVAASLQAPKLFTIARDLRQMKVDVNVDEADIGAVRAGQRATFTVDAFPDQRFEGRVEQIRLAPQVVQNVVTYTVVVSADNPELKLLPGMTASVRIVVAERSDVLRVPHAALRFRPPLPAGRDETASEAAAAGGGRGRPGGGSSAPALPSDRVWVLGPDGRPEVVKVSTGIRGNALTEITGGDLNAGQRVVVGLESAAREQAPRSLRRLRF